MDPARGLSRVWTSFAVCSQLGDSVEFGLQLLSIVENHGHYGRIEQGTTGEVCDDKHVSCLYNVG